MLLINKEEAAEILQFDGLENVLLSRDESHKFHYSWFCLPKESSVQLVLSERLADVLVRDNKCWVYVTDWNAGPTSMCYELFYGYRSGRGDGRTLHEASVYSFLPEDNQYFMCILYMILAFSWDAWIFDAEFTYLIYVSNDGIIKYSVNSNELSNQLAADFLKLKMPSLEKRS